MAYFRCTTGGSGKGNTLVVTCADDLAGATITCTNGTKTYTKTCPSTSPYEVTFYGLEAGTWTVSATVSGNTYTTTVVVADTEALLGGFNWKTWVDTARFLDSSDYDSLDEVLADELALRELALEHACVDYMAEIASANANVETIIENDLFAKWVNNSDYALDFLYANTIIADYMDDANKYGYGEWVITDNTTTPPTWAPKGNVPIMTSNTAPYGTAFAKSSWDSSFYPWKAFDGSVNNADAWATAINDYANTYLGYMFKNPICVRRVTLNYTTGLATDYWGTIKIQGSNDTTNGTDGTWTDIETYTQSSFNSAVSFSFDNDDYYLSLRAYLTNAVCSSNNIRVVELQFYGRELSVSVPTMTSNTTPYGEASCSSYLSNGYNAFNAFDNALTIGWLPNSNDSFGNAYVQFEFSSKVSVKKFYINKHTSDTVTFKVKASNDGTFTDIGDITDNLVVDGSNNVWKSFDVNSNNAKYFRVVFVDSTNPNHDITGGSGYDIQFFGVDYSEKEFEEGTTKKWLYDHGVELETLDLSGYYQSQCTVNPPIRYSDHIRCSANAGLNISSFGTENKINVSDYTYYFAKSSIISELKNMATLIYRNDKDHSSNNNEVASASVGIGNEATSCIDISSINQLVYLAVRAFGKYGSGSTTYDRAQTMDIYELWLE